jgi:hypothetical protein
MNNKYVVLKNSGIRKASEIYILGMIKDLDQISQGMYVVHVERTETNGHITNAYLYQGDDLDEANKIYSDYSGVTS